MTSKRTNLRGNEAVYDCGNMRILCFKIFVVQKNFLFILNSNFEAIKKAAGCWPSHTPWICNNKVQQTLSNNYFNYSISLFKWNNEKNGNEEKFNRKKTANKIALKFFYSYSLSFVFLPLEFPNYKRKCIGANTIGNRIYKKIENDLLW